MKQSKQDTVTADQLAAVTQGKPRRRRRVFLWLFLLVQAAFIAWLVSGIAATSGTPTCANLDPHMCQAATDTGRAIGAALIVIVWCVVDFLLGCGYVVYRIARRP